MTAKKSTNQGRISTYFREGGREQFFWLARIYTPVLLHVLSPSLNQESLENIIVERGRFLDLDQDSRLHVLFGGTRLAIIVRLVPWSTEQNWLYAHRRVVWIFSGYLSGDFCLPCPSTFKSWIPFKISLYEIKFFFFM